MPTIQRRHNRFRAVLRVPTDQQDTEGKAVLYKTMAALTKPLAQLEAMAWEVEMKSLWQSRRDMKSLEANPAFRSLYLAHKARAQAGDYTVQIAPSERDFDPVDAGLTEAIWQMADMLEDREPTLAEKAKLAALNDVRAEHVGMAVPERPELALSFAEVAAERMKMWRLSAGLKAANTGPQKESSYGLFASYWGERPIGEIRLKHASEFVDAIRQLDPNWARTGKANVPIPPWPILLATHGNREKGAGLADATLNRHLDCLVELWDWAAQREHCFGVNPFKGHRVKLSPGRNKNPYAAWTAEELSRLFAGPFKHDDLREIMAVAVFTGMRLNEVVSLTAGQLKAVEGVTIIDITDAKTAAGVRQVPLHDALKWLQVRAKGLEASARLFPRFRLEGPGDKPGGDAGKQFSAYKSAKGYKQRTKTFHSFRKNVVGFLEEAGVPENEVAVLVGHAKPGFTFGTYGTRAKLERLKAIVDMLKWPEVTASDLSVPSV